MEYKHTVTPLPGSPTLQIPHTLPLPGVVIFVHGVNSDGEWYKAGESGLCDGLNVRLARQCEQMACHGPIAGQLLPMTYTPELTSAGFIDAERTDKTYIDETQESNSNTIQFRWGMKASKDELKEFGEGVWLNENDYWGGGPFANGCSSIADLWAEGVDDRLFLWLTAQHINPLASRDVYTCPPRAYYVHAAMRLAKLVKSIRDKQADCPITIICHSQGNMVGIASALLSDQMGEVPADNYILNNPPLSLVPTNPVESWAQRFTGDPLGHGGREDLYARQTTLKNYFEIMRGRVGKHQDAAAIDALMANTRSHGLSDGFNAEQDRQKHGLNGSTHGRVTLYCCPHDQVISATNVQGIGWLGMSREQISATNGAGVFTQRVFAQGYEVGQEPGKFYDYWNDRWNKGHGEFWHPPSPAARYSIKQGMASDRNIVAKLGTVAFSPLMWLLVELGRLAGVTNINAVPRKDKGGWRIPIEAPRLPQAFKPESVRYGKSTADGFDEAHDPAGNARDSHKAVKDAADPYDSHETRKTEDGQQDDAAMGNAQTEAQMRYEDRARLRMQARREGLVDKGAHVDNEDADAQPSADYRQWRTEKIKAFLDGAVDQNATDHSTIVTNAKHARQAMAYDVAIGLCTLTAKDWRDLRVEADWRYAGKGLKEGHPHKYLSEYFATGMMGEKVPLSKWVKQGDATMPKKVIDQRSWGEHDKPYPEEPPASAPPPSTYRRGEVM